MVFFLGNWNTFMNTLHTQGNLCLIIRELHLSHIQKVLCWMHFPFKKLHIAENATIRKAKQFVLHHAVCKTPFVLSLKTIISLLLKACASVCDSFRNCKTVKRAKMPKWNIYILYQNIDAYFDGLCVIILPRIDSLLWARAENYFRWFIFLFNGVMRDILKFCT